MANAELGSQQNMSASRQKVCVVGGSGFIGTHIVAKLAAAGYQVIVPTRRRDRAKHLALLPGVEIVEESMHQDSAIASVIGGCTAVINCVGILHGRTGEPTVYGPDFAQAHVDLPKRLADAAVNQRIRRFIQISALGVTADGKRNLPSRYLRSKAAGEQALRSTLGLDLTVLRPSVVFGAEDRFLNLFAKLQAFAPMMMLPRGQTRFAPVWVEDVAKAVVACLERPQTIGQVLELAGPEVMTLKQLVQFAGAESGHSRPVICAPDWLGKIQTLVISLAPGPKLMSLDNFDSMAIDNVSAQPWPSSALGFEPSALSQVGPKYLNRDSHSGFGRQRTTARR